MSKTTSENARPGASSFSKSNGATPRAPLSISRNKHWRYISAFHGPWLQLPLEILEAVAHNNYLSSRPLQAAPGVLYDLLNIRRLVDEASDLAVRAQNGTASSALSNCDNGLPGAALGFSSRGAGGNAKLSPERKFRMRELATQKLAQAYRLDEVAASVATMQSGSALENVATLVLQRSPGNLDAKYVHFFHEKIPSKMMSQCTSLAPLNDIIATGRGRPAVLRTRALANVFKEDHLIAIHDLNEGLALVRLEQTKHRSERNQLMPMNQVREEAGKRKTWGQDGTKSMKLDELDQPKGIEMQMLFYRGQQYLTLAYQNARAALEPFRIAPAKEAHSSSAGDPDVENASAPLVNGEEIRNCKAAEAREVARKHAKKALRDFMTFLSQLDYAHIPTYHRNNAWIKQDKVHEKIEAAGSESCSPRSESFTFRTEQPATLTKPTPNERVAEQATTTDLDSHYSPLLGQPIIHDVSVILSTSLPAELPPFPAHPPAHTLPEVSHSDGSRLRSASVETVTYHPLLVETLHSVLLTHCLLQTPSTCLLRHAHNVARLVRVADGYLFSLPVRTAARGDWVEILRKTRNWIGLCDTWEALCKPPAVAHEAQAFARQHAAAAAAAQKGATQRDAKQATRAQNETANAGARRPSAETPEEMRAGTSSSAALEAAEDPRAAEAMEGRAARGEQTRRTGDPRGGQPPAAHAAPLAAHESDGAEPHVCSERVDVIARWVMEAPPTAVEGKTKRGAKKRGARRRGAAADPGVDGRQAENGDAENGMLGS